MVSGFKKDSRIKAEKQGLSLAKDKKQLILAAVIICAFILCVFNSIIKITSGDPPLVKTVAEQPSNVDIENAQVPTTNQAQDANNIYTQALDIQNTQPSHSQDVSNKSIPSEDDIEILTKNGSYKSSNKMVAITVAGSGRSNPFLPMSENVPHIVKIPNSSFNKSFAKVHDDLPFLTPPPEKFAYDQDAGKIMRTTISGILYDKYSPSAIINIEGTDYLVKKGDTINHYRVLSITQDQVLVQLGRNIYRAGVGELLAKTEIPNVTANLNNKFGGNGDITIKVRKKG